MGRYSHILANIDINKSPIYENTANDFFSLFVNTCLYEMRIHPAKYITIIKIKFVFEQRYVCVWHKVSQIYIAGKSCWILVLKLINYCEASLSLGISHRRVARQVNNIVNGVIELALGISRMMTTQRCGWNGDETTTTSDGTNTNININRLVIW